jgi:hypothetical protein
LEEDGVLREDAVRPCCLRKKQYLVLSYAGGIVAASLTRIYHGLFLLVVPVVPSLARFLVLTQSDPTSSDGKCTWPYPRTAEQTAAQCARETT